MERDKSPTDEDITDSDITDSPEWTQEEMARSKSFAEAFPDLAASLKDGIQVEVVETASVRLARDVLAHYRAFGDEWEARINADLRKAAGLEP